MLGTRWGADAPNRICEAVDFRHHAPVPGYTGNDYGDYHAQILAVAGRHLGGLVLRPLPTLPRRRPPRPLRRTRPTSGTSENVPPMQMPMQASTAAAKPQTKVAKKGKKGGKKKGESLVGFLTTDRTAQAPSSPH